MTDPIISVVIPCYNHGEYLLEAVASVENCREPIYEIVIVNDGSTDKHTLDVFAYLKNNGYQVIDRANGGLAEARNTGVRAARGTYYLPLDADNKTRPEYLLRGVEILDKNPQVGIVYGNAQLFGEKKGLWEITDFEFHKMLNGNYIDACAVIRKQVWQDCGGYDPHMPLQGYEDWEFWLSAIENGWQFHYIRDVLFDYRIRSGSMVGFCNQPDNRRQLMTYVCTKHVNLYTAHFAQTIGEKDYRFLVENDRADACEEELARSLEEIEELQQQRQRLQERLSLVSAERLQEETRLQQDIARLQAELEEREAELTVAEERNAEREARQTEAEKRCDRAATQLQAVRQEIDRVGKIWAEKCQQQERQFVAGKKDLEAEVGRQRVELTETRARLHQAEEDSLEFQTRLHHANLSFLDAQRQLQEALAELQGVREAIAAMQSSKFWQLRERWAAFKRKVLRRGE